ncbi:hypothetical protein [Thermovenabulum sp.]
MGRPKVACRLTRLACSRRADPAWWGKALLQSIIFDCSRVPTYHAGSS